ncbi:RHS repeat domain-containing protein [Pseudomonas sp. Q11]|uniref:RHS repeat domain-containing protein n=1 Tax=Pseudomonas sp. Q11 TaxID=2968470 RepID=UPI00210E3663|nr:RHS repeat-associated core domain-containing protein [Pseudomonas sp. Q11]MCQ6257099.1 RHS repeat-associated core domain-containing protein [Pseudomonas sp. Q11]
MGMDQRTPRLMAFDPRSLPVRSVDYWRNTENGPTQQRITRNLFDATGRLAKQWDPRLWFLQQDDQSAPANLSTVYSLSAAALRTDSVDAGMQIDLPGLASEGLQAWDGRGTHREVVYDDLLRPVVVLEQSAGQPRRCVERLKYGYPGQGDQNHNQYGQLIRHDDTAGTLLLASFALTGQNLMQDRRYILDAALPDWPEPESDREQLLEPGSGAVSTWRVGPLSDVLERVDARGNRQRQCLALDGRLSGNQLLLAGQGDWQTLVSDIRYDALGQIEGQTAGNGVQTTLVYSPEDGRLAERQALRAGQVLQHLRYVYDPMGNVLSIEDAALAVRYFANQRIDPISRFVYDSLYQLIKATGWEAGSANQGPDSQGHNDPAAVSNYQQTYRYDEGGNLLALVHVGAQSHGREILAARYSNRCLPYRNGVPPTEEEIAAAFDARGNCLELDAGRSLVWDLRNQLSSVTPIERASELNDSEAYVYDGGGQRVRKLRTLQTGTRTLTAEVRYLPGLELHADSGTGEALQVVIAEGGLSDVRVLHWESAPPTGENDGYRFSLVDHLGSVCMELALDGRIISREHFYPFGETASLAGGDAIEVGYKTVRYSGKERDATGLYYYGFRYYTPWLQRWVNPDPAGQVDGLNLYRMLRNNPMTFFDEQGAEPRSKTALSTATGIYGEYQQRYSDTDRQLPFEMMADITDNRLNFKTKKAPETMLAKVKDRRFTLRHYTVGRNAGEEPSFKQIASNFSLVHKGVKTLGGKGGNTNEKDWTKAGNSAFTFFLLAIDGEANERKFLQSMTHYAEYDLEDDNALEAALGKDFETVEFFASPDVLEPKHSSDLGAVPMVRGRLKDLKALLVGNSGISPAQVGRLQAPELLNTIDQAFGGTLEIKIPGSINVRAWHKKSPIRQAA